MINKKTDDNDVVYSPEKGFWGQNGWSWSLGEAIKLSSETNLILGFSKKTRAKRISLSHCLIVNKYDLGVMIMGMAVSLLIKNRVPKELKPLLLGTSSVGGLVYIKNKDGELGDPIEEDLVKLQLGVRYFKRKPKKEDVIKLARKILPADIGVCEDGNILIVKHGGERKFERAPKLAPYEPAYKLKERNGKGGY